MAAVDEMEKLFVRWEEIRAHMIANGMSGKMTVQLQSDDFDYHLALASNRDDILSLGDFESIAWFRMAGITFQRKPHHLDN